MRRVQREEHEQRDLREHRERLLQAVEQPDEAVDKVAEQDSMICHLMMIMSARTKVLCTATDASVVGESRSSSAAG